MKKIKLLCISDMLILPTGVGIQIRKLLFGLNRTGMYDIVQLGGSILPLDPRPQFVEGGIKVYPAQEGYGRPELLRHVMIQERPDILLCFADPRFFQYVFMMDNEIRGHTKLVFYHTWDNGPFPLYNMSWYEACDDIVMLSKLSHDLISSGGIPCSFIPHGMDPTEFYPMDSSLIGPQKEQILVGARGQTDFVIFWNNRNISRKRPGDVIYAFREFSKRHTGVCLLMNTSPLDPDGTDLIALVNEVNSTNAPIVFNFDRVSTQIMNTFYNISDVTVNIAYNEGFGLCVTESLCAGTPVICTATGGMTEQMTGDDGTIFGELLQPAARELFGVPGAAYIWRDYVSIEQLLDALERAYQDSRNLHRRWKGGHETLGYKAREHIIQHYHVDSTVAAWHKHLQEVSAMPNSFKPWRMAAL